MPGRLGFFPDRAQLHVILRSMWAQKVVLLGGELVPVHSELLLRLRLVFTLDLDYTGLEVNLGAA